MKTFIVFLIILTLIFELGCKSKSIKRSTVSFNTLLDEMIDRDVLTRYPDPVFSLYQASSWDRAEKNKQDTNSWFANKDYDNYLRIETKANRTEYVIMEAKGPGAITRWWFPQEKLLSHRTVRIYIDDNPQPVIEENYENFINGSSFVKWPFAFTSSDEKDAKYQYSLPVGFPKQIGGDFYLPIPFSRACKITLNDKPFYYAIDYRIYKKETEVQPFSKEKYNKSISSVQATAKELLTKSARSGFLLEKIANIAKNQIIEIDLPSGEHAINAIHLKINSRNNKQMNRSAILQIFFDGKQTVWSPIAEFFGGGVYATPVKNRNMEVSADGWMISNWVMPYKKMAKIILKNFGTEPISAELKVAIKNYSWKSNSMYFHAGWHEEAPLNSPPFKDWNYIQIKGKGTYVGDVLTVHSVQKVWWGEGDEKIYIDGESFPSQLGTGLEDYYGYAWGLANYFNSPFISMPDRDARGKADWRGYNTVARIRLLDDIPFNTSLSVNMEAWTTKPGVSFSVTCFWYGMFMATDNIKPNEETIVRQLPDFHHIKQDKAPGEVYPDPAENQLLMARPNGIIKYVGDQLDLLEWRDENIHKTYDGNRDNILGTAGYCIFGERIVTMQQVRKNSVRTLPSFVTSFTPEHITYGFSNAFLFFPEERSIIHNTGLIEVKDDIGKKGLVSFTLQNAPSSLRLGIMLDNADTFKKVGRFIIVTNTRNGSSGKVALATSNRIPDWYFFDLNDIKNGDQITIHGITEKNSDIFTIGALTFDLNN